MQLNLYVAGEPVPKGSYRAFKGGGFANANPRTKDWELRIAHEAQEHIGDWPPEYDGAVSIEMIFYLPRPKSLRRTFLFHTKRPDTDKLIRAALDGITSILIHDDSQVFSLCAEKYYADERHPPGLHLTIADAVAGSALPAWVRNKLNEEMSE